MADSTPRRLDRRAPNSVCGLLNYLAVNFELFFFFTVNPPPPPPPLPPRVAVLRKGGIKEIARISLIPPLLNTVTQRGEGEGGFTVKKKEEFHWITAKFFSNPHTEFGAHRSRRQRGLPHIRVPFF